LDRVNLSNYRPISHLSFLSKPTVRIVKLRLTDYMSNNNFLYSFQSAYIKCHSTEITLLFVHDHLIKALSLQQVSCLTLLDLSTSFDTIDHSVLLERLSAWFAITSTALSRIKSYLLNQSFYVIVENTKSSLFNFSMVFLKDLFSDPFSLSCTPLLSVLSNQIHPRIINYMLMILNFSYLSLLLTLHTISLFLNLLYQIFTTGCHLTFSQSLYGWVSSCCSSLTTVKTQ
jgi:Reverse transcriptase (RNA-dependent DNA polymerase)